MGVEFASLPAQKLLQIDVERRLKNSDSDGARSDSATDIRQKVVGIVERKSDANALEIRPQPPPNRRSSWAGRLGSVRPIAAPAPRRPFQNHRLLSRSRKTRQKRTQKPIDRQSRHSLRPRSHLERSSATIQARLGLGLPESEAMPVILTTPDDHDARMRTWDKAKVLQRSLLRPRPNLGRRQLRNNGAAHPTIQSEPARDRLGDIGWRGHDINIDHVPCTTRPNLDHRRTEDSDRDTCSAACPTVLSNAVLQNGKAASWATIKRFRSDPSL